MIQFKLTPGCCRKLSEEMMCYHGHYCNSEAYLNLFLGCCHDGKMLHSGKLFSTVFYEEKGMEIWII